MPLLLALAAVLVAYAGQYSGDVRLFWVALVVGSAAMVLVIYQGMFQ